MLNHQKGLEMALTTAKELAGFKHNGKSKTATRYGLDGNGTRFYLWVYPTNQKEFYYKSLSGGWHKLGELTELYTRGKNLVSEYDKITRSFNDRFTHKFLEFTHEFLEQAKFYLERKNKNKIFINNDINFNIELERYQIA